MITRGVLACVVGAALACAQETQDAVFLKDATGTRQVGRVIGADRESVKLQLAVGAAGAATVTVPKAQIDRIEFAPSEAREKLLGDPNAGAAALGGEWRRWGAFLDVPKSPAPELANACAFALLRENKPEEALALFQQVEAGAWSDEARKEARQGRLRAMVACGKAADAVSEAEALAKESNDPEVLIEATFILAEADFAQLQKLQEENPRWQEDVFIRPARQRLYEAALDRYLHPYLFFGSDAEAASRGLWGAVRVHRFNGDDANAIESARDIVMLYPDTPYAQLSQEYLNGLPEELKKQDREKEAQDETME